MAGLFDPVELEAFAFSLQISEAEVLCGLKCLRRLQHHHRSGYLQSLNETHVEQSFNERVFAEAFGYATLFSPGATSQSSQNLLPQVSVPNGQRPDFVLGQFNPNGRAMVVTAELKGANTDLDTKRYKNKTPVEQAAEAAEAQGAPWFVVSNFNETRLYSTSSWREGYESVRLAEIESVAEFKRAFSLFSRRALLGSDNSSPLLRLSERTKAGQTVIIKKNENQVRIIQRSRPIVPAQPEFVEREFSYVRLEKAFLNASNNKGSSIGIREGSLPDFHDGFLTYTNRIRGETPWSQTSVDRSGAITFSRLLPQERDNPGAQIDTREALVFVAHAIDSAHCFYKSLLNNGEFVTNWVLEDLRPGLELSVSAIANQFNAALTCPDGVTRTTHPEETMTVGKSMGRKKAPVVGTIVRELFFPFCVKDNHNNLTRFSPSAQELLVALGYEKEL